MGCENVFHKYARSSDKPQKKGCNKKGSSEEGSSEVVSLKNEVQ